MEINYHNYKYIERSANKIKGNHFHINREKIIGWCGPQIIINENWSLITVLSILQISI